jgi:hypothetical protein
VQDTRTGKITELLRGAPSGARLGAAGSVALMESSLRLEHLLAVGSDETEPFLRVLPDELNAWDELGDLLETKARTIGFEEITAQPYVEAIREVVRVYRLGVEGFGALESPA